MLTLTALLSCQPAASIDVGERNMTSSIAIGLNLTSANHEAGSHRQLASPGCQACCYGHDCRIAFSSTSAGICCGTYPRTGCCPLGSSCVNCGTSWRCSRSRYVTPATRRSVCSAGYYQGGPGYYHGGYPAGGYPAGGYAVGAGYHQGMPVGAGYHQGGYAYSRAEPPLYVPSGALAGVAGLVSLTAGAWASAIWWRRGRSVVLI